MSRRPQRPLQRCRRPQAVDEGIVTVRAGSGFGAASTGRGTGASLTGGSTDACADADAFTVVLASTQTILTATGAPSTSCAGAKRDCLTALTTELTSSVS